MIKMKESYIKNMTKEFLRNEDAVSTILGYILNIVILLLVTGGIVGVFYQRAADSSRQDMSIEFTDLGSQIARDITNAYIVSENSSNISVNITKNIPLTIGGKGYVINLNGAISNNLANISISDFYSYRIVTTLNDIDSKVYINCPNGACVLYSGSGKININLMKNNSGEWLWIY